MLGLACACPSPSPSALTDFRHQAGFSDWPWPLHDWLVLGAIIAAIVLTRLALNAQREGDRAAVSAEMSVFGEDATKRQNRIATEQALRRAYLERSHVERRAGDAYWVLAVVAGGASSIPWIALPGVIIGALLLSDYKRRARRVSSSMERRLQIFEKVRKLMGSSLSGPYILDSQIHAAIEAVFSKPDEELDELERQVDDAQRKANDALEAYAARRRAEQNGETNQ
jgi:hypothetical protein